MTLAEWMSETGTTPAQFALAANVHVVTVYHWRARRKFPRVEQLRTIEHLTDGAVTAADFVPRAAVEPVPAATEVA